MPYKKEKTPESYSGVKKDLKNESKYGSKKDFKNQIKMEYNSRYVREAVEPSSPSLDEKEMPNFEPSGLLAAETNNRDGIPLKYFEPNDSVKPDLSWRLYIFKSDNNDNKPIKILNIDKKEYYLVGKDHRVVDINLYHPSISKQHAAIQYRLIDDQIIPYLIDLDSTNGTFINDSKLESSKYYELREKDIIKFGYSTREYVLLNDKST